MNTPGTRGQLALIANFLGSQALWPPAPPCRMVEVSGCTPAWRFTVTRRRSPPAAAATAGEGSLDTSFSTDGKVTTLFGGDDSANALAVQANGKIVVAGQAYTGSTYQFALTRYNANGSLDTTFSGDGKVTTVIGGDDAAYGIAIQSDGKIVAVGKAFTPNHQFAVARYTRTGSLDTTFSGDGIATTPLGNDDEAYAVAIQSDGKIVVVGRCYTGADYVFALARFTSGGALDPTFSGDGKLTTAIGTDDSGNAVAIQADGKIVVAGEADTGTRTVIALARYTRSGVLDSSFHGTGTVTTPIGDGNTAWAVRIQPNGKIVVGGEADNGSRYVFALARYNANGSLDTSFHGTGKVTTPISTSDAYAYALVLQRDGKIVAVGRADTAGGHAFALARYRTNGALDTSFSGDGKTTTVVGSSSEPYGAAMQRDGKIVAAGYAQVGTDNVFALTRYLGDTTAPTYGHMVGLPRYSTSLTRTLKWAARDDNTGVKTYTVRYKWAKYTARSYGAFTTWRTGTTATSGAFTGQAGRTYCFNVRPRDWAGNPGTFGPTSCMAFPVDDRSLTASTGWTKLSGSAYYLGTAHRSSHEGATLQLHVHYRHLALVASTGPGNGTVKVMLGSTLLKKVSLQAATVRHKVVIAIASSSAVKSGTLKIVQVSAGKPVTIEGLAVSVA
jgi:uncharacterized delta-60 repeat protein